MYKSIFLILAILLFISCEKEDDPVETGIIGTYYLIETLIDPGNGSGTFQSVSSNKSITFDANGTVSSNGDLCTASITANQATTGTYSLVDSTISSTNCATPNPIGVSFRLFGGDTLVISYPCIEPCQAKFAR